VHILLTLLLPAHAASIQGPFDDSVATRTPVPNGGFEDHAGDVPQFWNMNVTADPFTWAQYGWTDDDAYRGISSLSLKDTSFTNTGVGVAASTPITVIGGETYVLSGYIRHELLGGGQAYLDLNDESFECHAVGLPTCGAYEWAYASCTFTVPVGTTSLNLRAVIDATVLAGSRAWFDEIAVTRSADYVPPLSLDQDCDGFRSNNDDCDDSDPTINPLGTEVPGNDLDEDCNGLWDCYRDADHDTVGTTTLVGSPTLGCQDDGESYTSNDCDDTIGVVYPGAPDLPADGLDNDCDGDFSCYVDADGDTFGSTAQVDGGDSSCRSAGVADNASDCDDTDAGVSPLASETPGNLVDENCDDVWLCYVDADGYGDGDVRGLTVPSSDADCGGTGESLTATDCDDTDVDISTLATDLPGDPVDQDCDGTLVCFVDTDGDGFGTDATTTAASCTDPGVAVRPGDCDDSDPLVNPDGVDDPATATDRNCDGLFACYIDGDQDGIGRADLAPSVDPTCSGLGESPVDGDCDDGDPTIAPGAPDLPGDTIDQDCDGLLDCYLDADDDTHGVATPVTVDAADCEGPGVSSTADDCDDTTATISPTAASVPGDTIDQDCDGLLTCYVDGDDDGFGRLLADVDVTSCDDHGYASVDGDCDDGDAGLSPDAIDDPGDEVDEDCSGSVVCWRDADLDSWGGDLVDAPTCPGGPHAATTATTASPTSTRTA
jgi:hypothetical protein